MKKIKILLIGLLLLLLSSCSIGRDHVWIDNVVMLTLVELQEQPVVNITNPVSALEACPVILFIGQRELASYCWSDLWASPNPSYGRGYFLRIGSAQIAYSYPFYVNLTIR